MATATTPAFIPLGEYLASTYRPDVDYVDGVLEERHAGDFDHSDLQSEVITLFRNRRGEWNIRAHVEMRLQLSPTRVRIPYICVLRADSLRERIVKVAVPLLCVEVLSPRETVVAMRRRIADYFARGVQTVWILDPDTRTGYQCGPETIDERQNGNLTVPGTPISLSLEQMFSVLDA